MTERNCRPAIPPRRSDRPLVWRQSAPVFRGALLACHARRIHLGRRCPADAKPLDQGRRWPRTHMVLDRGRRLLARFQHQFVAQLAPVEFKSNRLSRHELAVAHILGSLFLWAVLKELAIPGAFFAAYCSPFIRLMSIRSLGSHSGKMCWRCCFICSPHCGTSKPTKVVLLWWTTSDGPHRWYWLSLLAFLLAMLSKGSVAIFPIVLLLIAWWQRDRITKADLIRTAPFFLVAIALTAVNVWFRTHGAEITIRSATFVERLLGTASRGLVLLVEGCGR